MFRLFRGSEAIVSVYVSFDNLHRVALFPNFTIGLVLCTSSQNDNVNLAHENSSASRIV